MSDPREIKVGDTLTIDVVRVPMYAAPGAPAYHESTKRATVRCVLDDGRIIVQFGSRYTIAVINVSRTSMRAETNGRPSKYDILEIR